MKPKRMPIPHHYVYVIELDPAVLTNRHFREANPGYRPGGLCVYVGMTGLDPTIRFENHRRGHKPSRIVKRFGLRLREDFYRGLNPMRFEVACRKEQALALELRAQGLGVWQK